MLNNHTECDHLYLGDQSNILYSTGSMSHWLPSVPCRLRIQNTPTTWQDFNPELSISYSSKARKVNLLVTFHYYSLVSAACDVFLKLFDTSANIGNSSQPTYLANTTQLAINGLGIDTESSRTTTFIIEDFPANTSKTLRVACKTVATSGHHTVFYGGPKSKTSDPVSGLLMYGGMSLYLMATDIGNTSNSLPTGWEDLSPGTDEEDY